MTDPGDGGTGELGWEWSVTATPHTPVAFFNGLAHCRWLLWRRGDGHCPANIM